MENAKQTDDSTDLFGSVIYSYTRAQAIEDGYLIDITDTAHEAGFTCPVAITHAAWEKCVAWTDEDSRRQVHQDQSGRLWDVAWMAYMAIRRASGSGQELLFRLYRVPRGGRKRKPRLTTLKLIAGPGDEGELVITIMLPHED
jgi:hypothetical protein